MKNTELRKAKDRASIERLVGDIMADSRVKRMDTFRQHGRVSTYEHCERVTECSYRLNRRLHLGADEKALLTGAMLHDFYLYDWHRTNGYVHRWHGFRHAEWARRNAVRYFDVGQPVQDIIRTHMWPLNLISIPRSREAWIVTLADKYCAAVESLCMRKKKV